MKRNLLLLVVCAVASLAFAGEPELVGHWKLDEKEGDVAADSSPFKNNAKLFNAPGRVVAPFGGALAFDGKTQYVEIPNSKELEDVQEGSFTLAAWFKADDAPPGTESANDANYTLIAKTGWHLGLAYSGDKKFTVATWLKGETPQWIGTGAWDMDYEPGEWFHVATVVDRTARTVTCYVNGEAKGTSEAYDEAGVPQDYAQTTWKIGAAAPGSANWAWYAKAAIGDVRIYNGALSETKIKAIYDRKE